MATGPKPSISPIAVSRSSPRAISPATSRRSAYDRVIALLDDDSFTEFDPFVRHRATQFGMEKSQPFGESVVTGFGTIDGRQVAVIVHREAVFAAIPGIRGGEIVAKGGWPVRDAIRRRAWHILDHAWEMEDKDLSRPSPGLST